MALYKCRILLYKLKEIVMSKVGEHYRELDEMNGNNIPEPSDEELAEIEKTEIEFLEDWSPEELD